MRRSIFTFCFIFFLLSFAKGQNPTDTTYWHSGGAGNLNFSQVALSNWTGGGQSSISGTGIINIFAEYNRKRKSWENSIDLSYGLLSQNKGPFIKSDDKLELNSKYGRRAFDHTFYTAMLNFRSQFSPGYAFPENDSVKVSDFMAPGYLMANLGLDYKPNEHLSALIAPAAGKFTLVNDQKLANKGAYGVEPAVYDENGNLMEEGETFRWEAGASVKLAYKQKIMKNITVNTNVSFFSNYLEQPQNIDINGELLLNMSINDYIQASLSVAAIYDDDIDIEVDEDGDGIAESVGPRTQLKQVLSVGLSYSIDNRKEKKKE